MAGGHCRAPSGRPERILLGLGLDDVERAVDDLLGGRLLAFIHDRIHELGDDLVLELRIGRDLAFFGAVTAGHRTTCFAYLVVLEEKTTRNHLGRFAPYLDRRCRRSLTPWVSSTPRMMW
jgi:hypothetical protein